MECNYENEVLRFYDWLETNRLAPSCIVLWHELMHTYQKAGCPGKFEVRQSVLETKTGLKEDAIRNARNTLAQRNKIVWQRGTGNQSGIYIMILFDEQIIDPKKTRQSTRQVPSQSTGQIPYIYNNNINNKELENVVVFNNTPITDPKKTGQSAINLRGLILKPFKGIMRSI